MAPGAIVGFPLKDGKTDSSTLLVLDRDGQQLHKIPLGGDAGPFVQVLPHGKLLARLDDALVLVDTQAGTASPVAFDRQPLHLNQLEFGSSMPWITIDSAGDSVVLGDPEMSQLALVNIKSGTGTSIDQLLGTDRVTTASLSADGNRLVLVDHSGLVIVPTSKPQSFQRPLPGRPAVWVAFSQDGNRFVVADTTDTGASLKLGDSAEAQLTDTHRQAANAKPVKAGTLLEDKKGVALLKPDGTEIPVDGLDHLGTILIDSDSAIMMLDDNHRVFKISLSATSATAAAVGAAAALSNATPLVRVDRGPQKFVALIHQNKAAKTSTEIGIVDAQGMRSVSGIAPFARAFEIPGGRLSTFVYPEKDSTTVSSVIDLPTGKVLLTAKNENVRAPAPDGSAVVTAPSSNKTGAGTIRPLDGSPTTPLTGVYVLGWATG